MLQGLPRIRRLLVGTLPGVLSVSLLLVGCSSYSSGNSGGTTPTTSIPPTSVATGELLTVTGGSTLLTLDPDLTRTLQSAGVTITAHPPVVSAAAGSFSFPVSGGQVGKATLLGTITHNGSITITHGGKSVVVSNVVLDTAGKQLTAALDGQRQVLARVELTSVTAPLTSGGSTTVTGKGTVDALTNGAVSSLDDALGTQAFTAGKALGSLSLLVKGTPAAPAATSPSS
jgi:hypothetical protein